MGAAVELAAAILRSPIDVSPNKRPAPIKPMPFTAGKTSVTSSTNAITKCP